MSKANRQETEVSTEERIKAAAKKIFTQKGFAATRTRDIAQEAGINLALLNYYFRSKEKLYDIILLENLRAFIQGITVNVYDAKAGVLEKIEKIASAYIDFLTLNPDLPLFILNELKGNPSRIAEQIHQDVTPIRAHLIEELRQAAKKGLIQPIDPFHFMANLIGLTVFPFVGKPILQRVTSTSDKQFLAFMEERKKLIPIWLKMMMAIPPGGDVKKNKKA